MGGVWVKFQRYGSLQLSPAEVYREAHEALISWSKEEKYPDYFQITCQDEAKKPEIHQAIQQRKYLMLTFDKVAMIGVFHPEYGRVLTVIWGHPQILAPYARQLDDQYKLRKIPVHPPWKYQGTCEYLPAVT